MNAFLLLSTVVIGLVMAYGIVAAPWWLQIALGMVIANFTLMLILAHVLIRDGDV